METRRLINQEVLEMSRVQAKLASMQYSVSTLLLVWNSMDVDFESDMLFDLQEIGSVLEQQKEALIRMEDVYKIRARKRK